MKRSSSVLVALSFIAWLVTGAFCLRAHWASDFCFLSFGTAALGVRTHPGAFSFTVLRADHVMESELEFGSSSPLPASQVGRWYRSAGQSHFSSGGFELHRLRLPNGRQYDFAVVPGWAVNCPFGVLPGVWAFGYMTRGMRRRRRGLCVKCGYDLRGGAVRCPECGSAAPSTRAGPAAKEGTSGRRRSAL